MHIKSHLKNIKRAGIPHISFVALNQLIKSLENYKMTVSNDPSGNENCLG